MTASVAPVYTGRCTYCHERVVLYVGGRWVGADSDERQCTGQRSGVLHDVERAAVTSRPPLAFVSERAYGSRIGPDSDPDHNPKEPTMSVLLHIARRLLDDVREGSAEIVGLGGNVRGVECFRSTRNGTRVQVLVTVDDGVWTVSACPLPPLGCGPDAAAVFHDAHDHTEDDVILYGDDLSTLVADAIDLADDKGWT